MLKRILRPRPSNLRYIDRLGRIWIWFWFIFAFGVSILAFLVISRIVSTRHFNNTNLSIAAGTIILGMLTKQLADNAKETVQTNNKPYIVVKPIDQSGKVLKLYPKPNGGGIINCLLWNIGKGPGILTDISLVNENDQEFTRILHPYPLAAGERIELTLPLFGRLHTLNQSSKTLTLHIYCHDMDDTHYYTSSELAPHIEQNMCTVENYTLQRPTFYELASND